jgi:hypothetical protein
MQVKFSKIAAEVPWKNGSIALRANSVWDANDPFVQANPDYFANTPEQVETSSGVIFRGVEQATAAPGEKRGAVR